MPYLRGKYKRSGKVRVPKPVLEHVGSLSYIGDILIYKLYVKDFLWTDEEYLEKYFSIFGEVVSVDILTKTEYESKWDKHTYNYAFVCFKTAESASKALRHKKHLFAHQEMTVTNAKRSHQPFQIKRNFSNEENNFHSNFSILDLNDDCLLMIFKYFSFKDHINMSTLCSRLKFIFELFYKTRKSINFDAEESFANIEFEYSKALQIIGKQINHLNCELLKNLYSKQELILEPMLKFCPNLHTLRLESFRLNLSNILEISNFETITHLGLINSFLDDRMVEILSNMSAIEYLDLSENRRITGLHLEKFENVKTLILSKLVNLKLDAFKRICSKATKLKVLNINGCNLVNGFGIQILASNSIELEKLTISISNETNDRDQINQLSSLKHLVIIDNDNNTLADTLFSALVENKENIETLKIISFSYSDTKRNCIMKFINLMQLDLPFAIKSERLIEDISKLRNLKILNIPNETLDRSYVLNYLKETSNIEFVNLAYNLDYNDDFLKEVIEVLKEQNRKQPLTLNMTSTGVSIDIKEQSFIKQNANILKINMDENEYNRKKILKEYGIFIQSSYGIDYSDCDYSS